MSMSGRRPVLVLTLVTGLTGLSANEISIATNLGLRLGGLMTVVVSFMSVVVSFMTCRMPLRTQSEESRINQGRHFLMISKTSVKGDFL
jgi:hypothetical protein